MQLSYQTKVVGLIFIIFFSVTSFLTFLLIYTLSDKNLADIERQLSFTSHLLDDQLLENKELILNHANSSTQLQEFLQNANKLPHPQKLVSLHSIGKEFKAHRAILIDKTFTIVLDTNLETQETQTFPHSRIFSPSKTHPFDLVAPLDKVIYQWILFPIQAENSTQWFALGYDIDHYFRHHLDTISPLNVSLGFAYEISRKKWVMNSPDMEMLPLEYKEKILSSLNLLKPKSSNTMTLRNNDQVVMLIPLIKSKETPDITALILYSYAESFDVYYKLIYQVIIFFIVAFILLTLGLILLNRMFAKKLSDIVQFVEKVDRGEYQLRLPYKDKGVIGQLSVLLNNMIYKIQLRENELIRQTRFDSVTELPNKTYVLEYLDKLIHDETVKQMMVVLVNINRFPQINHALGHRVADRLLHHVGARISSNFSDAKLIGKMSGNSFVILLADRTVNDADEVGSFLLDLFENPFSVYTVTIDLSAHVGFSFYPEDGKESDTLIQKADVAVFEARNRAEHFTVYDAKDDPHQFNKLSLMSELREGLLQDELEVYYQPKVDLQTDQIIQVEALIRWHHPYRGFMPPNLFIPMAEETGHIKKLTYWLLNKVFSQMSTWEEKNINLKISVNLSVKDLLNKQLMHQITHILQTHKINPENILFEITESAFMQDPDNALGAIKKISTLGFQFSIDDFGTGYSSMSYIKTLPASELKIDREFISDIATNERDAQIVKSTIELGHSLGLVIVAEGIEDEDSVDILKDYGCDIGQGYLFSKPMPIKELEVWLMNSKWGLPMGSSSE